MPIHAPAHSATASEQTSGSPDLSEGLPGAALPSQPGFSALDVELAELARELDPSAAAHEIWAVALVSRAVACGHTAVDLRLSAQQILELVMPAQADEDGRWARTVTDGWHTLQAQKQWSTSPAGGLLVAQDDRLYIRRLWAAETRVAQALLARLHPLEPSRDAPHAADSSFEAWLQRWLPSSADNATEDQQRACRQAATHRLTLITGGPGTGKTFTAARLIALLQAMVGPQGQPLRIGLAAPTGKAAARLHQALQAAWATLPADDLIAALPAGASSSIERAVTLHRLLGHRWITPDPERAGAAPDPLALDVLIVDEASMVDLRLMDAILRALPQTARLILIGDRHQLASVEAGSVLADLVDGLGDPGEADAAKSRGGNNSPVVALRSSRRFRGDIARWAAAILQGDQPLLRELMDDSVITASSDGGDVRWLPPTDPAARLVDLALGPDGLGPLWAALQPLQGRAWEPDSIAAALKLLDRFRILCAVRQGLHGVQGCNDAVERELVRRGWADPSQGWYHGQPVLVSRNEPDLGLHNGDVGLVICSRGQGPRLAWLEGAELRSVACVRLGPVETAHAMTVHKSQGSEFDHVALVLPPVGGAWLSRELVYTGLTRARNRIWISAEPDLMTQAAARASRRMGGLADRLRKGHPQGD